MAYNVTLTLAIGIAIAMLYEARVGCSCGGLITPGAVALAMRDPERIAAGILIAADGAPARRCFLPSPRAPQWGRYLPTLCGWVGWCPGS